MSEPQKPEPPLAQKPCHGCGKPLGKVARVHLDGEEPEWYHLSCSRVPEETKR